MAGLVLLLGTYGQVNADTEIFWLLTPKFRDDVAVIVLNTDAVNCNFIV